MDMTTVLLGNVINRWGDSHAVSRTSVTLYSLYKKLMLKSPPLALVLVGDARSPTDPTAASASRADGHGSHGRSAGQASISRAAPSRRAMGASGLTSRPPHARRGLAQGRGRR
jgi:hypothetical protein